MKNKKIVLSTLPLEGESINWTTPPYFDPTRVNKYMPLGILSLASNLPKKHEVVILDPSSNGWTIDETIEKIEQEKITVECPTCMEKQEMLKTDKTIKCHVCGTTIPNPGL